jgi:hypothetical protein
MIVPEPGNAKKIAQELLALADNFRDVDYVMWPEPGFRVPEALAAKFVAAHKDGGDVKSEVPAAEQVAEVSAAVEGPVKRKPGRPKKIQGGQ